MLDDNGLYLLLTKMVKQAELDAATPKTKCDLPPYNHTYHDCAASYLAKLRSYPHDLSLADDLAWAVFTGGQINGTA